jgi:hypothetical protein
MWRIVPFDRVVDDKSAYLSKPEFQAKEKRTLAISPVYVNYGELLDTTSAPHRHSHGYHSKSRLPDHADLTYRKNKNPFQTRGMV